MADNNLNNPVMDLAVVDAPVDRRARQGPPKRDAPPEPSMDRRSFFRRRSLTDRFIVEQEYQRYAQAEEQYEVRGRQPRPRADERQRGHRVGHPVEGGGARIPPQRGVARNNPARPLRHQADKGDQPPPQPALPILPPLVLPPSWWIEGVVPTIATHNSPLPVNMHPPSCTFAPLIDPTAKVLHDEPSMEAGPSTDTGHPPWTVDAYVPDGAPDVISDGKVFKADQGWTICDHHPLMIHADVTRLHELLLQHVTCFASKLSDLQPGYSGPEGPFALTPPGVEMQVPASSKLRQPRRRSPIEEQVMDEHNQPLADAGFIEPAHRAVLSHESVIVVKKNPDTGEWTDKRCCHNYSEASGGINGYTPTDPYQLPLPEDLFRRTEGSKFFSVIDMKSGFMQTHMDKSVRHLCAFWWKKQLWQPTRNNFGLKNMPAYFQRVMDRTIADAGLTEHACVFIDDVLVFTKDLATHMQVLDLLFKAFASVNLKMHPGKTRICFPCIEYIGHNIGPTGLTPNEAKVAAIQCLPVPTCVSELRRVLGFANYYRGYVPHFSEIAKPLTDLLKKDMKWDWTADRAEAWAALKEALCRPGNALRHPVKTKRYILHTDWSQKGMSAILGQLDDDGKEFLIACTSRSCNVHEAKYGSYKGEMMAAVWGVRSYRCYLLGVVHPFVLLTDHKGLSWLMSNRDLEGQYARWAVMLSEYNFIIEYKPGITHTVADVPSRLPRNTTADTTGTRESFHMLSISTPPQVTTPVIPQPTDLRFPAEPLYTPCGPTASQLLTLLFPPSDGTDNARLTLGSDLSYADVTPNSHIQQLWCSVSESDMLGQPCLESPLFTPAFVHSLASLNDSHAVTSSDCIQPFHLIDFPIHECSSAFASLSIDVAPLQPEQAQLLRTVADQVEACRTKLFNVVDPTPLSPTCLSQSGTLHSIDTAPLPQHVLHDALVRPINVIELFGGMISGLDCLLRCGVHIHRYHYCDCSSVARSVAYQRLQQLSQKYPLQLPTSAWERCFSTLPQDVYHVRTDHLIEAGALEESPIMLIAGFECADLSAAGSREGLSGRKSSTFYPLLDIISELQSIRQSLSLPLLYLIENTTPQHAVGPPVVLDAARVGSYAHRLRNYWTNLASPSALQFVLDSFERDPSISLLDVLEPDRYPQLCRAVRSYPYAACSIRNEPLNVLPTLVAKVGSYAYRMHPDGPGPGMLVMYIDGQEQFVDLTLEERERILGYPTGSTNAPGISFSGRHSILGGTFDAFAVSHLLACAFALGLSDLHPFFSAHTTELGGEESEIAVDTYEPSTFSEESLLHAFTLSDSFLLNATLQYEAENSDLVHSSTHPDIWLDTNTLSYLQHDQQAQLLQGLTDAERKRVLRRASAYTWDGSLLHRKLSEASDPVMKIVPKTDDRAKLVYTIHSDNGHFGRRRTTALVMMNYWWPGLWDDCSKVVKSCQACSVTKVSFNSVQPVLHPLPIRGLMYRWSLDTCGPFPVTTRGHTRVLVAVEHFSKFVEIFPLKDKSSAEIAYHFLHGILARYGACAEVVTDGGGEFQKEFDDLLLRAMIDHRITSPHHPEANGASERFVKTVKTGMARCVESSGTESEWDMYLPWIALGYRVTPHESTKLSPFQLVYACKPILPASVRERLSEPVDFDNIEAAVTSIVERAEILSANCAIAGQNLLIAQHRDTLRYAKLRSGAYYPSLRKFTEGQYVYVVDHSESSFHKKADPTVLRVQSVRPSGVLVLIGRDGKTMSVNAVNCAPCHLPVQSLFEHQDSYVPPIDQQCVMCHSPDDAKRMLLCDSCDRGYHLYCLKPPLTKVPPGSWVCDECIHAGVNPETLKTLKSQIQYQTEVSRLRRIKNRQRQERAVAARQLPSQAAQLPAVIAPPVKRGRGRPKKLVSSLASLSPEPLPLTFDWTNMAGVLHGLSYLMPGPWSEYYAVYFANRVPDGQTENANRTVEDMIRAYVSPYHDDWDEHLTSCEFAYNDSEHASHRFTPFYLAHGHHPRVPLTMLVPRDTESTSEPAHAFVKRVRRERERAIEALKQAQDRMARNANKHRREHTFQVDDKVWLAASHVRLPHALTAKRKLQPRYYGPFRVTKVVSDVAYKLELPPHFKIHPVIHISHLKANQDGSQDFPSRPEYKSPPPAIIVGEGETAEEYFSVGAIRNHKYVGKGRNRQRKFWIQWEGYGEQDNTWKSERDLRIDMEDHLVDSLISDYVQRTGAKFE
ncbi:hypothetical protein CEUSTIGMA_g8544.t1 [Chlamydomonas eustigma]|uniref:Reverse transcriptase n=1 Tax=Chlamydomonas eustigma TaxID=1157962 RepID=A0A250XEB9_9CHLO|nr:hypothetical protein CEUSTIGMA_g8544.t1 [Chlamydomonas eustigma]|eukprot:GAX81110.1 hypothetical protein CEUSTIGMA_g8544.t1 [Chlamydomonas eustigma]